MAKEEEENPDFNLNKIEDIKRKYRDKEAHKKRRERFRNLRVDYKYGKGNPDQSSKGDGFRYEIWGDPYSDQGRNKRRRNVPARDLGNARTILSGAPYPPGEYYLKNIKNAAKTYEKYGKGNKPYVQKRLLKIGEQLADKKSEYTEDYLNWLGKYLKRNPPRKHNFPTHKLSLIERLENWLEKKRGRKIYRSEDFPEELLHYDPLKEIKKRYTQESKQTHEESSPKREKQKSLESSLQAISSIVLIGLGLFLISTNITGNVIGSLINPSQNIIGVIFILLGITLIYYSFKNK